MFSSIKRKLVCSETTPHGAHLLGAAGQQCEGLGVAECSGGP